MEQFQKHRIVSWYDGEKEFRHHFREFQLPGVQKIEINNNQFKVKYRVLRQQPEQKFLLYHEGPEPRAIHNWLLDVQLAYGQFRTDQISLWLAELQMEPSFAEHVRQFPFFFNTRKRRKKLKTMLTGDETLPTLQIKMLAVCTSAEPRFDDVVENLLNQLAGESDEKFKLLQQCQLESFLWEQLQRHYGYQSQSPGIQDFAISLFKYAYNKYTQEKYREQSTLNDNAYVFLKRWKDSTRHRSAFEKLSRRFQEQLNIVRDVESRDYRLLNSLDIFPVIDEKIISDLLRLSSVQTLTAAECHRVLRLRRQSCWYGQYLHRYRAVCHATQFFQAINQGDFTLDSITGSFHRYADSWYAIDQHYRKYHHHLHHIKQPDLFKPLTRRVREHYIQKFLSKVNPNWRIIVETGKKSVLPQQILHSHFFESHVKPFLDRGKKVDVIISDALRYESGKELHNHLWRKELFETSIKPALVLPSEEEQDIRKPVPDSVTMLPSSLFMQLKKAKCRAVLRANNVLYIHHQGGGEGETLEEIVKIVKKLTHDGVTNILVTAPRGFQYCQGEGNPGENDGFSLQEAVVPVIHINRKRRGDISPVEVDILDDSIKTITNGQVSASFLQVRPIDDRNHRRVLRAGIYTRSGTLISDSHRLTFDFISRNTREREIPVRFVLTREARQANGQEVFLRLEEQIGDTSHYNPYKSRTYLLKRSFSRAPD